MTLTEELGVSKYNPLAILMGWLEKLAYKKADLIVGTMPNLSEHVKNILGEEREVFFSPIGINEVWSNPIQQDKEIDRLFPKDGKLVVGYSGSMGKSNALDPLMRAIKTLSAENSIRFVLVGDGDVKPKIKAEIGNLPNVIIGPRIQQSQVPYFLSNCDVLYLSTHKSIIWRYGWSLNKILDYMMAGKPIIASYSGYPSMINEANCGVFVEPGDHEAIVDAILKFKDMSPEERAEIGIRGRNWAMKNRTYEVLARNYMKKIVSLF